MMSSETELTIKQNLTVWPDRLGVWTSALCVVHCLVTPVLLSMSAVFVHFLPSEQRVHRSLAPMVALIGVFALIRGFRTHRRLRVFCLMGGGVACIFFTAFWGESLPNHWIEVAVTFMGSLLMISAHRLNHTFCKDCSCAAPTLYDERL
jgi:hypothetical protein